MRTALLLFMFCARIYAWTPDAECFTAEGNEGMCTSPRNCFSVSYEKPVPCRYSRGYGARVCCPLGSPMAMADQAFPSEHTYSTSSYNPFRDRPQPTYNKPQYHEKHTVSEPRYEYDWHNSYQNGRPSYESQNSYESTRPSYHRPDSYERPNFYDHTRPSYEYEQRPSSHHNRPFHEYEETPIVFEHEGNTRPAQGRPRPSPSQGNHNRRRTTPAPTWAVKGDSGERQGSRDKRISERKCEEYSRSVSQTLNVLPLSIDTEPVPLTVQQCHFSAVKLIVGGESSELGEFPHMAAVGFRGRGKIEWHCGGTLISERFVMTAAHCIGTSFGDPVAVRLGEYNIMRDNDGADPVDCRIEDIIIHPDYKKGLKYNDIALIRLDRPVTLSKWVRPACLYSDNDIQETPVAIGWGHTDFGGKTSDILMKVNLNMVNNEECNTYYRTASSGPSSFPSGIVDSQLCAGVLEGGRDTCQGDSGGPLGIIKRDNPCVHYVVGITSFGKQCAAPNSPAVYTRVSKYLSWLERTVWS